MRWKRWLCLTAGLVLLGSGCSDGTGPEEGVPEEELRFIRFPSDLAPLAVRDTTFWAVAGEDRELEMRYRPEEPDDEEGDVFLEFRVRDGSLLSRPDGSRFTEGDSVAIRVQVDEEGRFLFRFEPSGLRFDADEPAELRVRYRRLDGDLDGDGDVDDQDDDFEDRVRLWRQESVGEPWFPVGTVRLKDDDEVRGEIVGFTGFALAV